MRLPQPVYEALPWVYELAGVGLIWWGYLLRAQTGTLSAALSITGLVLLIVGGAVWLRRRDFRSTRDEYIARGGDPDDDPLR